MGGGGRREGRLFWLDGGEAALINRTESENGEAPLKTFGLITALMIVFGFLSSVFVLPVFLVMWAKWVKRSAQEPFYEGKEEAPARAEEGTVTSEGTTRQDTATGEAKEKEDPGKSGDTQQETGEKGHDPETQ